MKRLIIVCEGQTEVEFCKNVLQPFFLSNGILIEAPLIKHSGGGIVAWGTLKKQLIQHLNESGVFVTMLVDFYRIKDSFKFPGWEDAKKIGNLQKKMEYLFKEMEGDLPVLLQERFVPYIQLHEFEGLLFSNITVFENNFKKSECNLEAIKAVIKEFPNPEDINNGPNTAPSVRLKNAIQRYNKDIYGCILAEEIGLDNIRKRCPLFNQWIERLLTHL